MIWRSVFLDIFSNDTKLSGLAYGDGNRAFDMKVFVLFLLALIQLSHSRYFGVGFSKDLNGVNSSANTSNQFVILVNAAYNNISFGSSLRYYNMFQEDDRRLIYGQITANIGGVKKIGALSLGPYFVSGLSFRERHITAIERDQISDNLLHQETSVSERNGNTYWLYGFGVNGFYDLFAVDGIAFAPYLNGEYLSSKTIFIHNKILAKTERDALVYFGGGICIGF